VSREHFNLHHEMMVLPGTEFLAAKITGDVQHRSPSFLPPRDPVAGLGRTGK